ncbi:MAG: hypothetical protein JSS49_30065 [Planctomycetes bacterium]|nr:hypothetical protein [Planctomycetota bacterium]
MDQETIDALQARKTAILAEIAAFGAATASVQGKPSYNVDGQSFDWNGARVSITAYRKGLYDELTEITRQLSLAQGDWEVQDVVIT